MKIKISILIAMISLFIILPIRICFASSILPIEDYNKSILVFSWNVKISEFQKRFLTKKLTCNINKLGSNFLISPSCLARTIDTGMSDEFVLNLISPYIDSVPIVYNTSSPIFSYEATTPIFTKRLFPVKIWDPLDYAFLLDLQNKWTEIRISDLQLAYLISKSRSWYWVWKSDIWILKPCTKQNYYIAFNSLSGYVREAWTELNINNIISGLGWYCKWTGPQDLMFYGWVCGFATQLFRLSLLIPNVDTIERYWHSLRYVPYYSDYIYWDDAALYQNSKKLILKNNLDSNIYLKTLDRGTSTYLIGIVPQKIWSYVEIKREQVWDLKWQVTKIVKTLKESKIAQEFISYYTKKTYTIR